GDHDQLERVTAALKSPYGDTRGQALAALSEFADARAVPALVELTKPSATKAVIEKAAAAGGSSEGRARMREMEAASLRYEIAGALARFDNDEAREGLVSVFADPQPEIRAAAVASLASSATKSQRSADPASGDPSQPVQAATARSAAALRSIVDLLKKEQSPLVYAAILKSFSSFDRDQTADALLAALDASGNRDANIRQALTEIGITSELMARKLTTGNPQERIRAADALSRLGDRKAVPALMDGVANAKEPEVRARFAEALGTLGDR